MGTDQRQRSSHLASMRGTIFLLLVSVSVVALCAAHDDFLDGETLLQSALGAPHDLTDAEAQLNLESALGDKTRQQWGKHRHHRHHRHHTHTPSPSYTPTESPTSVPTPNPTRLPTYQPSAYAEDLLDLSAELA